jgi:RHS repeat-associated protein
MLVEEVTGGKEYYYHPDHLGSVRALTDSDGGVTDTYDFDAYGNRLASSTGTTYNPFGYTGQYTDAESGLLYLRARYYDPSTQQFLTVDPIVAQTEQAYAYAGGNPTNLTDPTGMFPCLLCINPVQALCNVFGGCLRAGVTAAVIVQKTYRVAEAITMGAAADAVGKACSMAGNLLSNFSHLFFGGAALIDPYGFIDESEATFTDKERSIAQYLAKEGKGVKAVPRGEVKTPDALVNGVRTEFKSLDPGSDSTTITRAIRDSLSRGGQARDIIYDSRGSGLTQSKANRAFARVSGIAEGRLDSLRIIGDDFDLTGIMSK